ncbi:MAG TPA: hypothetical protein VFQ39_11355, partial [Longimicrobium sp.]|nr:hypothetical protein [Longimicrobium sp.]
RRLQRSLGLGLVVLSAACGGGDHDGGGDQGAARPEEVDQSTSVTVTEKEQNAFTAPADSILTTAQVEAYLKTSLTQFDLIRSEAPRIHQKAQEMEKRAQNGGVLSGLRNAAEGLQTMAQAGDLIGGSYVRSARTLGYNPAEMEWVRERMGEVSGYLAMRPMMEAAVQQSRQLKEQAQQYRGQPGFTDEQVNQMIQQAEEMEKNAAEQQNIARAVQRNYEVLQKARPNVTDAMWTTVAFAGGAGGWAALTGLSDPADTSAQNKLNEFRTVYTDVLANRVSKGMEKNAETPAN